MSACRQYFLCEPLDMHRAPTWPTLDRIASTIFRLQTRRIVNEEDGEPPAVYFVNRVTFMSLECDLNARALAQGTSMVGAIVDKCAAWIVCDTAVMCR